MKNTVAIINKVVGKLGRKFAPSNAWASLEFDKKRLEQLGQVMMEPIRKALDYEAFSRKVITVQPMKAVEYIEATIQIGKPTEESVGEKDDSGNTQVQTIRTEDEENS